MRKSLLLFIIPVAFLIAGVVLVISAKNFASKNCGCGFDLASETGDYDLLADQAYFENKPVASDWNRMFSFIDSLESQNMVVLGETSAEKWIEVDLSDQRLYAHEGDRVVYNFLISSGKPWTPTVKGEFEVWVKYKYAKMSGGTPGTKSYYYLPNVPFIQYFYRDYGLHGAYWHNNFGQTMSHGCVNLSIPDSEKLFYWTSPSLPEGKNFIRSSKSNPGTKVIIHD